MRLQILTNGLNIIEDVLSRIVNILVAAKPYMNGMICRLTSQKYLTLSNSGAAVCTLR